MRNQIVGLAGEFFVAAELLKRNFQVSMTLGNAKSVDLFARDEGTKKVFQIQVKTLKKANCFDLRSSEIEGEIFYFFVFLNNPGEDTDFFIVKGQEILDDLKHYYGSSLGRSDKRETINYGPLKKHKNQWGELRLDANND